jgi:hypothetical protein
MTVKQLAGKGPGPMASEFDEGMLVGLLIGEGHFGGDGRQPHVTLRMHERHEALFRWLERTFPGGRLYGPYEHGGRRYFQWMARGVYLREELAPLLRRALSPSLDRYVHLRFLAMCERYARQLGQADGPHADQGGDAAFREPIAADSSQTAPALPAASRPVSELFAELRGEKLGDHDG